MATLRNHSSEYPHFEFYRLVHLIHTLALFITQKLGQTAKKGLQIRILQLIYTPK